MWTHLIEFLWAIVAAILLDGIKWLSSVFRCHHKGTPQGVADLRQLDGDEEESLVG
jgi:hypothetical protein